MNSIQVGSNTNIQDNAIVHVARHSIDGQPKPTIIGNNVTIGGCSGAGLGRAGTEVLCACALRPARGGAAGLHGAPTLATL